MHSNAQASSSSTKTAAAPVLSTQIAEGTGLDTVSDALVAAAGVAACCADLYQSAGRLSAEFQISFENDSTWQTEVVCHGQAIALLRDCRSFASLQTGPRTQPQAPWLPAIATVDHGCFAWNTRLGRGLVLT